MSTPTPQGRLVSLINLTNPNKVWSIEQLAFGTPQPAAGTPNTTIAVSATSDQPYMGSLVLRYNRVDLATIVGGLSTDFELGEQASTVDLVEEVAGRFGVPLLATDIVTAPLPGPNEEGVVIATLTVAPDSLVWKGSLTITLTPPPVSV